MSKISVACNELEKRIQNISGCGGDLAKVVHSFYKIFESLEKKEKVDPYFVMRLIDGVNNYNHSIDFEKQEEIDRKNSNS